MCVLKMVKTRICGKLLFRKQKFEGAPTLMFVYDYSTTQLSLTWFMIYIFKHLYYYIHENNAIPRLTNKCKSLEIYSKD